MLRNDLITLLAQYDNDPVSVIISGYAVDVDGVRIHNGAITIVLDADGLRAVAHGQPSEGSPPAGSP